MLSTLRGYGSSRTSDHGRVGIGFTRTSVVGWRERDYARFTKKEWSSYVGGDDFGCPSSRRGGRSRGRSSFGTSAWGGRSFSRRCCPASRSSPGVTSSPSLGCMYRRLYPFPRLRPRRPRVHPRSRRVSRQHSFAFAGERMTSRQQPPQAASASPTRCTVASVPATSAESGRRTLLPGGFRVSDCASRAAG